ncbi:MAG: ATP-binding protein, partial [Gammaproteobacteria bacterium]|nr:ATP-binding protein [Gammaproteobacteria bacterium]
NECRCNQDRIDRYLGRISGPLLDRLDLVIEVPALSHAELLAAPSATDPQSPELLRGRVSDCRELQQDRSAALNSELRGEELERTCRLSPKLNQWLADTLERLSLSARAAHRILRVARTIADLEGSEEIRERHLLEAVGYRRCRILRSLFR